MVQETNPIERLHNLLEPVIIVGTQYYAVRTSEAALALGSASTVWMMAHNIDPTEPDSETRLNDSLTDVLRLVLLCEQEVRRTESLDDALYSLQINRIKEVILDIKGMSWDQFIGDFGTDFLLTMQWASKDMSSHISEQVIDQDELKSLQSEIECLTEKVIESDIDENLRIILIDGLTSLRQAIVDYRISGAEGIRQALDRNIGLMARCRDEIKAEQDRGDSEVLSGYWLVFSKIEKVVYSALKYVPLVQPVVQRMLESGGGE